MRGLGRSYGQTVVLADVDLELRAGEVLGLIGPNGGGKSTLLMLLAGLVTPTEGTVTMGQVPTTQVAAEEGGQIGLVTAVPGLYPLLSGWENLAFFGRLHGLSDQELRLRAQEQLVALELLGHMDRKVGTWSSGMCQKLSLVRALLLCPGLLLLDEPTSNLDPVASQAIHEAVRHQAEAGVCVVLATHDLHAAEDICDRVAVIQGGVRKLLDMPGQRTVPAPSRLLDLYREHA